MGLSEREMRLLACIHHRANEPMKVWEKITGMREHAMRYAIGGLEERGVIVGTTPFIDMYMLGLVDYTVYFSVSTAKKELRDRLIGGLKRSRLVSWLCELGGDYQYGVTICAAHVSEAARLMNALSSQYGNIISDKLVLIRLSFTAFGCKYLWPGGAPIPVLKYGSLEEKVERTAVDEIDRHILGAAANLPHRSMRELARLVKIPLSTVERRIRRLEQTQVIRGYIYRLNPAKFGMQRFKLLLFSRGINPRLAARLFKFCWKHPQVLNFSEFLGPWDYELTIEVGNTSEVAALVRTISDSFPDEITGIKSMAVFESMKFTGYPDFRGQ
jgi:DNA-binding Lrp family transcriptional regulator